MVVLYEEHLVVGRASTPKNRARPTLPKKSHPKNGLVIQKVTPKLCFVQISYTIPKFVKYPQIRD